MLRRALGIGDGPFSIPAMWELNGSRRLERLQQASVSMQLGSITPSQVPMLRQHPGGTILQQEHN